MPDEEPHKKYVRANVVDAWVRNLLSAILASLVVMGVGGLYSLGKMSADVDALNRQMTIISNQIAKLIEIDLASVRERILVMEGKKILPESERRFGEINIVLEQLKRDMVQEPRENAARIQRLEDMFLKKANESRDLAKLTDSIVNYCKLWHSVNDGEMTWQLMRSM